MLSAAFAETVTDCDTVAPFAGAVSETVGGAVSAVTTAEDWAEAADTLPAASWAVTL